MRLNGQDTQSIEEFVAAVSGQGLSVAEIEQLAHGFFGAGVFPGRDSPRQLALPLQRLREVPQNPDGCSEFERVLLGDLGVTQKYMQRVMARARTNGCRAGLSRPVPFVDGGILSRARAFFHTLRQLHDRNGQA